jgi:hypothetical protein
VPAAGRSCRQSVRHSVRLSGPRRHRRLLSPDARGLPSAAWSSRGPARRRAPPPPGPALPPPSSRLSVRPSVRRPPAFPSFCPAASPPARVPAAPALSLPGSLSLCLCSRASTRPSLAPRSRVSPQSTPLIPHRHPFWHPHSSVRPLRVPPDLLRPLTTPSTVPQHSL